MFRIFFAVLFALLVFRCAVAGEPDAYAKFQEGCVRANAKEGAPAAWCPCLVEELRRRVPADALEAAMQPVADLEVFLAVQEQVGQAAKACRAKLRGAVEL